MHSNIRLNNGTEREGKTRFSSAADSAPKSHTIFAHHGEGLGAITLRAYGANTKELQDKILAANASLIGDINVPH